MGKTWEKLITNTNQSKKIFSKLVSLNLLLLSYQEVKMPPALEKHIKLLQYSEVKANPPTLARIKMYGSFSV